MCSADCFLAILAVLFPPIAVWVKRGVCSVDGIINIALLCLGYLPGLLHAWYIIAKYPDPYGSNYEPLEAGGSNQRVYYYTATYPSVAAHHHPTYPAHGAPQQRPQSPNQLAARAQNYGTAAAAPLPRAVETAAAEPQPKAGQHDGLPVADGMSHGESSAGPSQPPPSYSDVVKGDYKVQTA